MCWFARVKVSIVSQPACVISTAEGCPLHLRTPQRHPKHTTAVHGMAQYNACSHWRTPTVPPFPMTITDTTLAAPAAVHPTREQTGQGQIPIQAICSHCKVRDNAGQCSSLNGAASKLVGSRRCHDRSVCCVYLNVALHAAEPASP